MNNFNYLTDSYLVTIWQYIKIDGKSDLKVSASNVWTLMRDHWNVPAPKLIISVTGGAQAFRMNKKLRENFKSGLVQAASDAGEFH